MKNHSAIHKALAAVWVALLCLWATSCRESDVFDNIDGQLAENGYITLQLSCSDMLPTYIEPTDNTTETRAATQKSDAEKQINSLHLFFFGTNGEFATMKDPDDQINAPYIRLYPESNEQTIKIPKDCFNETSLIVVALANIQGEDPTKKGIFKTPSTPEADASEYSFVKTLDETQSGVERGAFQTTDFEIENLSSLKKWIYAPAERVRVRDLPVGGMPMMAEETINNTDQASLQRITMQSMMARIEVNIRLEPNQTSRDGTLPILTINEYGVKNMAATVPYLQPTGTTELNYGNIREEKVVEDRHQVAANSTGTDQVISLVYYTYENIQGTHSKAEPYPDGVISDEDKQRWKPIVAKDNDIDDLATAIVIRGTYQTHQGFTYNAQFTVYLGGNTTTDFSVKRNHCYTNNVSIHGLDYVRNDDDGVYTFDGRVNVIDNNNVWYTSIVNERKVDSHASVLPMDIYLVLREGTYKGTENIEHPATSTVSLQIIDDNTGELCDWIGFEMIAYPEVDEQGNGMIANKKNGSFVAGTRAKDYFYHNLVSDQIDPATGANKFNIRKEGTYTITEDENGVTSSYIVNGKTVYQKEGHIEGEESRMRIYFYVDENVPKSSDFKGSLTSVNSNNVNITRPARHATVKLTYENSNGVKRERSIEIDQSELLLVAYNHPQQSEWTYMYIETTEEYLTHSDPLEYHISPEIFEGLKWGPNGYMFDANFLGYHNYTDYYHNGLYLTQTTISKIGMDVKDIYLYNDTHGKTDDDLWAVTYAYGKNKRQSSLNSGETEGEVYVNDDCVGYWELPGIRDLETALIQYYSTFPEFQDNFYWSSATCKGGNSQVIQSTNYENDYESRATKISYDGSGYNYVGSAHGEEGAKYRTDQTVRIRAAYKTKAQQARTSWGEVTNN